MYKPLDPCVTEEPVRIDEARPELRPGKGRVDHAFVINGLIFVGPINKAVATEKTTYVRHFDMRK